MPQQQQQVIYLPAKRDTTSEGAALLTHALQQVLYSLQQRREEARQAALDKMAAEDRARRIKNEDIDRQRQSEAEIAKLAPETSMYEPAAPTVAEPAVKVPGEEDLGLPADEQSVRLGDKRLAGPMLTEITLSNGQKVPFRVAPSKEAGEAEAQAAETITFPDDPKVAALFRGKTYEPGDPGYAIAKAAYPQVLKQVTTEHPAPTVDPLTGLAWNSATGKFDLDVGHSKPAPKIEVKEQKKTDPLTGEISFSYVTFKDGVPVRGATGGTGAAGGGGKAAGTGAAAGGGAPAGGAVPGVPNDLKGEALYNSLDPNLRALLDQAHDGELDLTSKRLNPRQAHLLALTRRVWPDFNPTGAVAYNATVKEFQNTSPNKAGGNLSRINTALQHLEEWKQAQTALNNGDVNAANRFTAWLARQTGDNSITDFDTAAAAVSDELAAAYKGGAPDIETQRTWRDIFADAGKSPKQAQTAYDRARQLMKGRINGLRQTWRAGTQYRPEKGDDDGFAKFLVPEALNLYGKPGAAAGGPRPKIKSITLVK